MMDSIGARVAAAMQKRGLTQKQLAQAVGMTTDGMSRALNGKRGFAAVELAAISRALGADLDYLITGEPTTDSRLPVAARHRFDHETRTRIVERIAEDEQILNDIRLAYVQAGEIASSPALPTTVAEVREQLGKDFPRTFVASLEALGVDVISLPELSTAYAMTLNGRQVIATNASGNWFYENWSLAHELGHLTLKHEDVRPDSPDAGQREAAAHAFAAELLMPASEMRGSAWETMNPTEVADYLWRNGVSTQSLRVRLETLGITPSPEVTAVLEFTTQKVLRRYWSGGGAYNGDAISDRMEEASQRRFPAWLRSAHLKRIEAGMLHKETLAWMLGVAADELEIDEPAPPSLSDDELMDLLG